MGFVLLDERGWEMQGDVRFPQDPGMKFKAQRLSVGCENEAIKIRTQAVQGRQG